MPDKDFSNIEFDPQVLENALVEARLPQERLSVLIGYKNKNVINKIIRQKRTATANDLLRFAFVLEKDPKDFVKKI